MNDWPAEQGIIYDLLAANLSSWETQRSRIVSSKGWNHILIDEELPKPEDMIVHLTHPRIFPPNSGCEGKPTNYKCKYLALEYFLEKVSPELWRCACLTGSLACVGAASKHEQAPAHVQAGEASNISHFLSTAPAGV
jgi:hypothetical protein